MKHTTYKTFFIAEAAALLIERGHISRIEEESGSYYFVFCDEETCREISNKFYSGSMVIEPMAYYQALFQLKMKIKDLEEEKVN